MTSSSSAAPPPPPRPIKLLMLHGYTQSGPLFHSKTGALRKSLQKAFPAGCHFVYPTAPTRLRPADETFLGEKDGGEEKEEEEEEELDAWAWWRRTDTSTSTSTSTGAGETYVYQGLEEGLSAIAGVLRDQGPFDGVVGFSQGGAAAGMVASLLEEGRKEAFEARYARGGMRFPEAFEKGHPPLRFAVSYSGFALSAGGDTNPYRAFYEPKIKTKMLHFLGMQDVVVDEARSLALVEACEHTGDRFVVYHPGGHFLPSTQKASVNALIAFIKDVLHGEEGAKKEEESVEDMHVPF
ncbi:hypothetical protein ACEQ8H_004427 [Pleosporales sp. CAS-2024a]